MSDDTNPEGQAETPPTKKEETPRVAKRPATKAKATAETVDISSDPTVIALCEAIGDALVAAVAILKQPIVTVRKDAIIDALSHLRDGGFDLLLDVTAVHRPEETPVFEVVYQLVSTRTGQRLRVKAGLADGESIASACSVWPGADWLEREVYDMFGIVFDGHPDLRRILLPEGWEGHPLRKEYPLEFRENDWVRTHLNIVELPPDADFSGKFEV
jgi:NADH-quinone oxidoreductase subunit C